MYDYVYKFWQETDHICRSYIEKSNGPKFVDPRTPDDRPLFKRSMMSSHRNQVLRSLIDLGKISVHCQVEDNSIQKDYNNFLSITNS